MFDDSNSKKRGVTSAVYLKVIEEQVSTLWESDLIYMQDSASIYITHIIKRWFINNVIKVINWSFYFSNLNSIEHVWRHLKEWVNEHHPKLKTLTNNDEIIKKCMIKTLQEAWAALNDEFLKTLTELIKKRIDAIINIDD